jgi:hypothetical protein
MAQMTWIERLGWALVIASVTIAGVSGYRMQKLKNACHEKGGVLVHEVGSFYTYACVPTVK